MLLMRHSDRQAEISGVVALRAVSAAGSGANLKEMLAGHFASKRRRSETQAEVRQLASRGAVAATLASRFRAAMESTIADTPPTASSRPRPCLGEVAALSERRIVSSLLAASDGFRGQLEAAFQRGQPRPRAVLVTRTTHRPPTPSDEEFSDSDLDEYDTVPDAPRPPAPAAPPRELPGALAMARMLLHDVIEADMQHLQRERLVTTMLAGATGPQLVSGSRAQVTLACTWLHTSASAPLWSPSSRSRPTAAATWPTRPRLSSRRPALLRSRALALRRACGLRKWRASRAPTARPGPGRAGRLPLPRSCSQCKGS